MRHCAKSAYSLAVAKCRYCVRVNSILGVGPKVKDSIDESLK